MLLLLFSLFCSAKKIEQIEDMDGTRFKQTVIAGRKITVYVVLMSNPDLEGHAAANEVLEEAFKIGKGFLKFVYLDTSKTPSYARHLKLEGPSFCIYHSGGVLTLPGNTTARQLVNRASFMIPDFTYKITNELDEGYTTAVCVLFTERKIPPSLWTAISYDFRDKGHLIKIGFSNNKTLAAKFNITEFPKIMLRNSSKTLIYDGINEFLPLKDAINKFILKRLTNKVKSLNVVPVKQFKRKCQSQDTVCIIHTVDEIQDEFLAFRKKHTTSLLEFMYGSKGLPFSWMKPNMTYGIKYTAAQYFETENVEDLEFMVPQVLINRMKWREMEL